MIRGSRIRKRFMMASNKCIKQMFNSCQGLCPATRIAARRTRPELSPIRRGGRSPLAHRCRARGFSCERTRASEDARVRIRAAVLASVLLLAACGAHRPATPALEPTPNPTPVPAPTPSSARVACGVGAGTGDGLEEHCPRTSPSFLDEVDAAINRVVDRHPDLFDLDHNAGARGYFEPDTHEHSPRVVSEIADGSP